ncbi:type IX secretion system protein PorD [Neolewinella antarctica]|uniref:DUF4835 family protein n=1 Tax=Neolewinella antarctica TaxID=442734 RepID=A0ABX0XBQ6_9BACT|nr:DUF4835 family protein [Neolewinella antarctica]NJC26268.1 hypothetical protein [Neolewinella antarctica]
MVRSLLPLLLLVSLCTSVRAQSEIRWTVNLNTEQITQTDKSQLQALEKDLVTFLNGQTWTGDRFEEEERIEATVFLTIRERMEQSTKGDGASIPTPNQFTGTMAIQSLRPIYGVGDQTPVFNTQDENIDFSYRQGEGIQYSEQSYLSDLGTIMAFYSYIIIGLDYDTFSPLGGTPHFNKARELYNRLPPGLQNTNGWKTTARSRNRFFLMDNILDPRMLPMRRAYYNYHRLGLDMMTTDQISARNNITIAVEDAQKANAANPNSVFAQAFVDAKREEIIEIYKGATGVEQNTVITAMSRIDPAKSGDYRSIRFKGPATSRNKRGVR